MINSDSGNDRIEELKKKLFSKDPRALRPQRPGTLHDIHYPTTGDWKHEAPAPKAEQEFMSTAPVRRSFFKKFFVGSIILFVVSLVFAGFMFLRGGGNVSLDNIDIAILGNAFASGGEELPMQVEITNRNSAPLELADLVIEYPRGQEGSDMVTVRKSLGTIGAGRSVHENLKLTLFGEQGSTKNIRARLEYRLSKSNAVFVKEKQYAVSISSAPLALLVDGPTTTVSGQNITLDIRSILNSKQPAKKIRVMIEYPIGFKFASADPMPSVGNTIWDLGDFLPGMEKKITLKGSLFGQDGEERSFHIYSGEGDAKDLSKVAVIYNSYLQTLAIKRPFIEANLLVNGQDKDTYTAAGGKEVSAVIDWSNNLPVALGDVEITAKFSGSAFNKSAVKANNGYYNSATREITWDKTLNADFASVEPGRGGSLTLSFTPLPLYSGSLIVDPQIYVDISIKGKKPFESNQSDEVTNLIRKTIKFNSDFQIASKAVRTSGPFMNSGAHPPKSEQPTTYTMVWSIKNSSNLISDAVATATLPLWVGWVGQVSPSSEKVSYNEVTREVSWKIGTVYKGAGLTGADREAYFQVKATPSGSQIGQVVELMGKTSLTGLDNFTGDTLFMEKQAVTTQYVDGVSGGAVEQ